MKKRLLSLLVVFVLMLGLFSGTVYAQDANHSGSGPLLLQGAMDLETKDMIAALENPEPMTIEHYQFVKGTIDGYPVVVSKTEQGMSNAAASTVLAMEHFRPSAIINQGTSGGHDPALHTSDIVIGKYSEPAAAWKSAASGEGAGVDYTAVTMEGVYSYDAEKADFVQQTQYAGDANLIAAAEAVKDTYQTGNIVEGVISTSDEWNNQIDRMLFLHQLTGSSCEEMETNSAAQVAKTFGVPFLGIRILSNTGIYGENFNPATGPLCQGYVLNVAKYYIDHVLKH